MNLHVRDDVAPVHSVDHGILAEADNLRAAVALFTASYNFTWCHRTLKGCTPAMAAGIARKPWTVRELLTA